MRHVVALGKRGSSGIPVMLLMAAVFGSRLPAAASAAVYVETTDFPNSASTATNIGSGYTSITGTLNTISPATDSDDFFEVTGLTGNSQIKVDFHFDQLAGSSDTVFDYAQATSFQEINSNRQGPLAMGAITDVLLPVTVPANGDVIFGTSISGTGSASYTFSLPEPTSGIAAMAMGAVIMLKRRRTAGTTADRKT